ncbi:MAG TPA: DUF6491 family protein [Caulobacteraceae bacterium]|jgi:hypothetical protein|nr:DUF6491 family protein [Caulobacteraceae bacterium]
MKTLAAAALAALIAAPALADPAPAPAANPPPAHHNACFWQQNVDGFAAHDDTALYLRVGVREVYELKMFGNCFDLSWLHHIGLATHGMSNICEGPNPDVDVVVRDVGIGHQRCPVTSIRKLTPAEVAALPKDAQP